MKKLMGVLAAVAMVPALAFAQDEDTASADFSHSAEFRARYQLDQNISGNEDGRPTTQNDIKSRFRLMTTFRASDRFTAHFGLLHHSTFGGNDTSADLPVSEDLATFDEANTENALLVHEAYGSWMATDELMIRIGRGAFTMADGSVIATNEWEQVPYSFEGVLATYDMEFTRISAWGIKFADYDMTATGAHDPEIVNYGLSFDVKALPEWLKMANIHVIQTNADTLTNDAGTITQPGEDRLRYGLTLAGDVVGLDYRATYAANTGEFKAAANSVDREGSMYHVELGYTLADFMNTRFYAAYHSDTGDDAGTANENESYDTFFYDKHFNAGLMDVVYWGNLTYYSVGFTLEPMEQTVIGLHYHDFSKTEKTADARAGLNGTMITGLDTDNDGDYDEATNTSEKIGSEIDLVATKAYDGGFAITARAGYFMPGDWLKDNNIEDAYTQFFLEGQMNF